MSNVEIATAPEPEEVPLPIRIIALPLTSSPSLGSFRVLSAALDSYNVWQELRVALAPYVVIWREYRGRKLWYTFPITDGLLDQLRKNRGVSVQQALDLHEDEGENFKESSLTRIAEDTGKFISETKLSLDNYGAIIDERGRVHGVFEGSIAESSPDIPQPTQPTSSSSPSRGFKFGTAEVDALREESIDLFNPISNEDRVGDFSPSADTVSSPNISTEHILFPTLTALGSAESEGIHPNERVEFEVRIPATPQSGITVPLPINFDPSMPTVIIEAVTSSKDFFPLLPSDWSKQFRVNHSLACTPPVWIFPASAIGDRPYYSLTVAFHAAGKVVASLTYVLKRAGTSLDSVGVLPSQNPIQPMFPPTSFSKDRLTVEITEHGWDQCQIRLFEGANQWGNPVPWTLPKADYFDQLDRAISYQDIVDTGYGLTVNLPREVRAFLDRPETAGVPTIFLSNSRIAPFEIIQLQPDNNGPFLGIDRPVCRWTLKKQCPPLQLHEIQRVVCIRPSYSPPDNLPSAQGEEDDLAATFGSIDTARSIPDLQTLLNKNEATFLHFAGHAGGNPAELSLEQNGKFPAIRFHPSKPLLKCKPVFFINGCHAGSATTAAPSSIANFMEILLEAGCSSVIASAIAIDSAAARRAAKLFYQSARSHTLAEAVREVRSLCGDTTCRDKEKPTYVSYMVFCDPELQVTIR